MASSIAAITILRSIDFSRATASAICNSSSLFALIPACAISPNPPHQLRSVGGIHGRGPIAVCFPGCLFGTPQCLANEFVGQHEPGFADEPDRQADDLAPQLVEINLDADLVPFHALQDAAEPP